jgi:hypothetical protein
MTYRRLASKESYSLNLVQNGKLSIRKAISVGTDSERQSETAKSRISPKIRDSNCGSEKSPTAFALDQAVRHPSELSHIHAAAPKKLL